MTILNDEIISLKGFITIGHIYDFTETLCRLKLASYDLLNKIHTIEYDLFNPDT
jgi:hypothetical protein